MWTESDVAQFLYNLSLVWLFFLAGVIIVNGLLKTREDRRKAEEQARLYARRVYVPAFNHEYADLYLSLLEHVHEIQRKL